MQLLKTAAIEVTRDDETVYVEPQHLFGSDVESVASDSGEPAIAWTAGDEIRSINILGTPTWDGDAFVAVGSEPGVSVRVRALDPYDGVTLSPKAGVPQPLEVLRASVSQGGGIVAQELSAAVAADNTVVTLLLETELGTYVRYSGDWQLLSETSEALDDTWTLVVAPGALEVFDAADMASTTISAFDLPRVENVDGNDIEINPDPVGMEDRTPGSEMVDVVVAAGPAIPSINSEDDLDLAIRFGQNNPAARWYITKRADALGQRSRVPASWSPGGNRPFDGVLSKGQDGVRTAALAMVAAMSTGVIPDPLEYTQLLRDARREGMWDHGALVAARRWREWMHPRGRDGRFIHKIGSLINVFADAGSSTMDRNADKRRAMITRFEPDGVRVAYYNNEGKRVPASPGKGYPELIPTEEFSRKAVLAPAHIARIDGAADAISPYDPETDENVDQSYDPGMSFEEYNTAIEEFNNRLLEDPPPGLSALSEGSGPLTLDSEQWEQHREYVEETINRLEAEGLTTSRLKDSRGDWSMEVFDLVDTLVEEMLEEVEERGVPRDRKAVVLGGMPGSGKTYSIKHNPALKAAGITDESKWVETNSDVFKEKIAESERFKEIAGLGPLESATAIHELSSLMGEMYGRGLVAGGFNVIFDTTLGHTHPNGRPSFGDDIGELRHFDYDVDGIFIQTDLDVAMQRRDKRWLDGVNEQRSGKSPLGGRYVPNHVYSRGGGAMQARSNFDLLASEDSFDRWIVLRGNGDPTVPLAQGKGSEEITDPTPSDFPGVYGDAVSTMEAMTQ